MLKKKLNNEVNADEHFGCSNHPYFKFPIPPGRLKMAQVILRNPCAKKLTIIPVAKHLFLVILLQQLFLFWVSSLCCL